MGARRLALVLLLGIAPLVVGTIARFEFRKSPFHDCLVVDARVYHDTAVAKASGTWRQTEPHWQPPLYVDFLAAIYRTLGPDAEHARSIQVVLFAAIAILSWRLAYTLFGSGPAWITWALVVSNGTLLYFALQLLNPILAITLLLVSLVLVIERWKVWWGCALAGLALGAAGITAAGLLVVAPLASIWLLIARRRLGALLFAIAVVAPVFWTASANHRVSGEWIPISYNGGINFWIGNNPEAERTVAIRPGRAWKALTAEPMLAGHRRYGEQSRYFYAKTLSWMAAQPAEAFALQLRKARLLLRGDETLRNQEIYPHRADSKFLSAFLWIAGVAWPWGFLLPLALAGMCGAGAARVDRPRRASAVPEPRGERLLLCTCAAIALSVVAFFVTARYRLPLVPLLAVFAGHGLLVIVRGLRSRRWQTIRWPAIGAAAGLVAANLGLPPMAHAWNSDAHFDLGYFHQEHGRIEEAVRQYERALALDPENREAANNLGGLRVEAGRYTEAIPLFKQVIAAFPKDARALGNLGTVYLRMNEAYLAGWQYQLAAAAGDWGAIENVKLAEQLADRIEADWMSRDPARFLDAMMLSFRQEPTNRFLLRRMVRLLESVGRAADARAMEAIAS